MPNTSFSNTVSRFLEDPMAAVKVLVPSVAIEVILHKRLWQKTSLRDLTLYLAIVNTYWFATTLNLSFLETPLFLQSPHLSDQQKMDCGRQRFNWLNKIEVSIVRNKKNEKNTYRNINDDEIKHTDCSWYSWFGFVLRVAQENY